MADPTITRKLGTEDGSLFQATWTLTTADPTGTAVEIPEWADRTWTLTGTVGGATLEVQGAGANVEANFKGLTNASGGAALSFTTEPQCVTVLELPRFMRPKLTTIGSGATWTVILLARRATQMRT